MTAALLETKLFVPPTPRHLVPRPRLSKVLDRSDEAKLLMVSAPAGFGKTTVLSEWLARGLASQDRVPAAAWLTLDRSDNDPATFWAYLIAALRTVEPDVGATELALLQGSQSPPVDALLTTLLNDVIAHDLNMLLVLDDYHVIESRKVHEGITFLLDHLPPQLHLAITTRSDPPLPLSRLRARGDLVELRAADLRFTPEEASAYLNEAMRLELTAGDVTALEGRTEGWIAALQLAALSLRGRKDVHDFISGFTGDDRFVIDYLAEEVLQRQTEEVERFLTQTSVLSRFTGPLCDAVTGRQGGKSMLQVLERGNLFLVPLDDQRRWYRYHHLFADVLRSRLLDEQPEMVSELHLRASRWFEQDGQPTEAILHALAAEDFERTANLIEAAAPVLLKNRQEETLLAWLGALPDATVDARPVLSVDFAAALLSNGHVDGVDPHLEAAERWLAQPAPSNHVPPTLPAAMVVTDHDRWSRLPGSVALYRAAQARKAGDVPGTISHARRALDLTSDDDHLTRAGAAALLGLAAWTTGDLDQGIQLYSEALERLERADHIADTFGCALALADMQVAQGRLNEAMRTFEQALRRVRVHTTATLRGTADMHVGMSELFLERDDLPSAGQQLLLAAELGDHAGLPQNPYRWRLARAQLWRAEGDLDSAMTLIDDAEAVFASDFFPEVRPVAAVRARMWIADGRPQEALQWAGQRGLTGADELEYLHEYEHVTLARALLAVERGGPSDDVLGYLGRLLQSAEEGGRTGSVIELLVLLALGHARRGEAEAALVRLEPALALGEPEGYARVFVNEGPPMVALLRAAAARGCCTAYVEHLLSAAAPRPEAVPHAEKLVDPLSDRERDVLRLLATELSGPEIAGQLVVSLNTVRTHTQRIYAKLGVNNRRLAVRRARELELL